MTEVDRVLEPEVMDTAEEAASYDAMDHSEANAAFVDRLADLGACGTMLDIGTGPGEIPLLVRDRLPARALVAVDRAASMLRRAAGRLRDRPSDRSHLVLADAKRLPFPNGRFHTVFSNTILHHLPDPRPFLEEAYRVVEPGGVLLIRDLFRPESERQLAHLVACHAEGATADQRQMLSDSLRAALTPDEATATVRSLGWSDVDVVVDTDRHMSIQRPARRA